MKILPTKGTGIFRRDESQRGRSPVSQRALGIFKANYDKDTNQLTTMTTFNQLTLEHADKSQLQGLKTYRYTTRTSEEFFFSLVPFYKKEIYICSYTDDFEDAWITSDLEGFGQPI